MEVNSRKMLYLARLHGYVCGDGSAVFYGCHHRRSKVRLDIKIDDQACLDRIIEAFAKLGYSPSVFEAKGKYGTWFTVLAYKKKVVHTVLSLGPVGSHKWRMPDLQKRRWIREWVRAFFDSDATVTYVNREITLESVNQAGLRHLRTVLVKNFGIYSHLKFRRHRGTHLLRICGRENLECFYNRIGFHHQRKQIKLHAILDRYQKYYGDWGHLKSRDSKKAKQLLLDVFKYRGYFRVKANRYGSFELGSHDSQAMAKIANALRHYFEILCTFTTYDNQGRSWVRISRRDELRKLLLSGLLAKAPHNEAAVRDFLLR